MTIVFKKRHRLKQKEIKHFFTKLSQQFPNISFSEHISVDIAKFNSQEIILVDNDIDFFRYQDTIFFTLHGINKYRPNTYYAIVDMGAINYVTNGADIMAPGIVDADIAISSGDLIWIADETYRKPLAIGVAMLSGTEMKKKIKGRAIKNIHYVGDTLWKLAQNSH